VPAHVDSALAEEERRATGDADSGGGVTQRIRVHEYHRHGGVPSTVERRLAAPVGPEVCRQGGPQVIVKPDHRILEPP
jgi:hypothetical protein